VLVLSIYIDKSAKTQLPSKENKNPLLMIFQATGVIICLGYIFGLLFSAVPFGGIGVLLLGMLLAFISRKPQGIPAKTAQKKGKNSKQNNKENKVIAFPLSPPRPKPIVFIIAGIIGLIATFYLQWRSPQPGNNDISKYIPKENSREQIFIIRGEISSSPRLTRKLNGQIWLEAKQLDEIKSESGAITTSKAVTGKLYVTLPILKVTGLYQGQRIAITGSLYKPQPNLNPGGFDFQEFLKQEGAFAGLIGKQVNILETERKWGWWQLKERIVQSQVKGLGIPEGPLVSAMVLGSKSVDLPYDIRDLFVSAGLAHALAASGYQTSLILSVVLGLTKRTSKKIQLFSGSLALLLFLSLTGFQPSVLRATIMGFAALVGLGLNRKVQQFGSLVMAATILLLFNPIWIWDLGFQLSFLSTLGLIVTVNPILNYLQWLPITIASLIAVSLACTIWTLPRLLNIFSVILVYSIPINIIVTPLISIISLGGMISAVLSFILPDLGTLTANLLYHPAHLLIQIAEFFVNLPGNFYVTGSISNWQMLFIYGLIMLTWWTQWWQKKLWLAIGISIGLILIPVSQSNKMLFRITVLAANREPVIVIQDKGQVTLLNSGNKGNGRFTIVPFLLQQGLSKIDSAISADFQKNANEAWVEILQKIQINNFFDYARIPEKLQISQAIEKAIQKDKGTYRAVTVGQTVNTGSALLQLINSEIPILQMQVAGKNWLLIGSSRTNEVLQLIRQGTLPRPQVLWYPGNQSLKDLIITAQPEVIILPSTQIDKDTLSALNRTNTKLFFTSQDGAIQWTPSGKFESFIQSGEGKNSIL
jgi:competence protein ComEC